MLRSNRSRTSNFIKSSVSESVSLPKVEQYRIGAAEAVMDTSTVALLVLLVFATLAFASYYFYRQRTRIGIKGPMGARFDP